MNSVVILIPDRIFYGQTAGPLYGKLTFGSSSNSQQLDTNSCTFHISHQSSSSSRTGELNELDPTSLSIGNVVHKQSSSTPPHPPPLKDAYHITFTLEPDELQLRLDALQIPQSDCQLTPTTRIQIVTTNTPINNPNFLYPDTSQFGRVLRTVAAYSHRQLERTGRTLPVLRHTSVFQHLLGRCALLKRPSRPAVGTLAADMCAGLLLTWLLLRMRSGHPYFHLTHCTEMVVVSVRQLLDALKGFPIGLKLNIELNNFLLGIFTYHIDLWVTFLVLIAPMLNGMFVPFVALGSLGLSFQLVILSDLLVFISLHAHCFYIYVAVLYHNALVAIGALWRVLRGMRHNQLKGRAESHDYTNPQLYLATMFFASLLFLLPTVMLYYVVFAFLRFCVYCATSALIAVQRRVLTLPAYAIYRRLVNIVRRRRQRQLCHFAVVPHGLPCAEVKCSLTTIVDDDRWLCGVAEEDVNDGTDDGCDATGADHMPDMLTVFQFFMGLVRGNIMGFILPLEKRTRSV